MSVSYSTNALVNDGYLNFFLVEKLFSHLCTLLLLFKRLLASSLFLLMSKGRIAVCDQREEGSYYGKSPYAICAYVSVLCLGCNEYDLSSAHSNSQGKPEKELTL